MRKPGVVAVLLVVGCGGGTPAPTTTNAGPPDASTAPTAEPQAEAGTPHATIESQHDAIIQQCLAKLNAPEYCNCVFDQLRAVFKDQDLNTSPDPAQLSALKDRTATTCNPKITEEAVKQSFTTSCANGDDRKAAYCECAWTGLRKKLPIADFLTDFTGPRFDDAKKSMVQGCKGKLPDDIVKADVMRACTAQAPAEAKLCECKWKRLRAKGSAEELAAGLVDLTAADVEACKKP
jgi:hypothetical protein